MTEPLKFKGYMCRVDFEVEAFQPMDGNAVYADIEDLKEHRKCTEGCGIVEVEVTLVRIVEPGSVL